MNEYIEKNITILCDTREKKNQHIIKYMNTKNIKYKLKKLNVGDYSFEIDGLTFEDIIAIERKSSLDELCDNFTRHRERFRKEFIRGEGEYVFLLIEDSTIQDIYNHNYRSKMHPNALLGSIKSWKEKYNIYVVFCDKKEVGKYMLNLFKRYLNKFIFTPENKKLI